MGLRRLMWQVHRRLADTATISTKQGRLTVYLQDKAIGKRLYCRKEFEFDLSSRVLAFLRRTEQLPPKGQGTVIDIGANMGVISIGMLYNDEFSQAIAIEPDPRNFRLLEHNVAQNGFANRCLCLPYAVSDHRGTIPFALSETNFGDHRVLMQARGSEDVRCGNSLRRVIEVETCSLDDLFSSGEAGLWADAISLLWVDVQGHEGHVFRGAKEIIKRGIPVVTEVWPYGLKSAGTSINQFCDIAEGYWSRYWTTDTDVFLEHSISDLKSFLRGLDDLNGHKNIIFSS